MIIKNDFDLSNISYIKVGGITKTYIEIENVIELFNLQNDFIAIGNCSKILFAFDYLSKTIVKFKISKIVYFKDTYFVYSGAKISNVYASLKNKGISGFEYISTIPGLIGGSIVNNASFLGQCISDNLIKILVYEEGKFRWISKDKCNFRYRKTDLNKENFLIIGAMFKVVYLNRNEIEKKHFDAIMYRKNHQNEYINTLGSTFVNKDNLIIGKVLDELGYKGFKYSNNVKISQKHANFIVVNDKTHYLEIYSFIDYLKRLLYYYLKKNISLEINVITKDGKQRDT